MNRQESENCVISKYVLLSQTYIQSPAKQTVNVRTECVTSADFCLVWVSPFVILSDLSPSVGNIS